MDNSTRSQENKSKEEGHQEAKEIVTEVNSAQNFIDFTEAEEDLVFRMHRLVGNRWDLIAGRIPGRTAAEVEMFWSRKHQEK